MLPIQEFVVNNIYSNINQDKQFNFSLVRVNDVKTPPREFVNVYNIQKRLPDRTSRYHVFIIGNINPSFLNLLRQNRDWFRDEWINFGIDMTNRNFIARIYNSNGVMFPMGESFYSFIDEKSLLIAIKLTNTIRESYDINSFSYLHVYSNNYFNTNEFFELPNPIGINYRHMVVTSNVDKVVMQNFIRENEQFGGRCLVFVNGIYTDHLSLLTPDISMVEIIYDQSITHKVVKSLSSLRTFFSTLDERQKYLVLTDLEPSYLKFYDDNDIYVTTFNQQINKGTYFYRHTPFSVRNVTDKDYSIDSAFLNNQAHLLNTEVLQSVNTNAITLFIRKPSKLRPLVFSNLKLHELYKLSKSQQLDVLLGTSFTLPELRVETLEQSAYFQIANKSNFSLISNTLASEALGYNSISHYFAKSLHIRPISTLTINVPYLYQIDSTAFEYDTNGLFIGEYTTSGPVYTYTNANCLYVEFIYGRNRHTENILYNHNDTITIRNTEHIILVADFHNTQRLTNWEDITSKYRTNATTSTITYTLNETINKKIKIVYLDNIVTYNERINMTVGDMYFPLRITEDRGSGFVSHMVDIPYTNIELYLNGHKLVQNIDFYMNFPFVSICNKKYIDFNLPTQSVHIRMYGFTLNITDINKEEYSGFVNHGVLSRNNRYDIRDDRNFCIYINGRIQNRGNIRFAETDNTIRFVNALNGLPYVLKEPFIPTSSLSGLSSLKLFKEAKLLDEKFSNFFNQILPQPPINTTNAIASRHILFSPTLSHILFDIQSGALASSIYTQPYDDNTILNLLTTRYKDLYDLDPVKHKEVRNEIHIHPFMINGIANVSLHAFRFLQNIVRLIGNDHISLSEHLNVQV